MAVLEDVPGIEVVVQVAGRDAIEYEDPNASERETRGATCPTSTKYIECIDGAEFSIRTTITNAYQWGHHSKSAVKLRFRMDGNAIDGSVLKAKDMINGAVTKIKEGQKSYCTQINKWVLQRFKFSAVDVDALKREMVIPRTPSPGPGLKREVAQMSRAELEQLARERLDQLESNENIKEECKPAIKREFGGIIDLSEEVKQPIKFSRPVLMVPNEVIDLTDD
ncbi:hypothetical protein Daesc_005718 [Daldinia eschscholtzii]|uniref:DUF7918 domain-containing protein n=1 Tax=Daldinia eschscholtzii TaxID=292717 RepID=A0AAX6MLQ1_9PEZI